MRPAQLLIVTILLALQRPALAADPPRPCGAPQHHQFDFWIGEWDVRTPDGKLAGTNRITGILGGCGLRESWTGAGGTTGTSLNAYDAARGLWHQTWIDSGGTVLLLEGSFRDGRMVLGGVTHPAGGAAKQDRITWEPLGGGDVRQLWEQSSDGGTSWTVVFEGRYTRRH
jgi:hypothetical protein